MNLEPTDEELAQHAISKAAAESALAQAEAALLRPASEGGGAGNGLGLGKPMDDHGVLATIPKEMLPFGQRPGTRSGMWWDESVDPNESKTYHIPDRPTTPSINIPVETERFHVEKQTADALIDKKRAIKRAEILIAHDKNIAK